MIGGFAATNDPTIAERLKFLQKSLGAVPGPFDCWLVLRGLKTLAVRMERHSENAQAVAAFLAEHPAVERVLYPGLPDHPGHEIAARQMRDFGGMISFLAGDSEEAAALVARTKVWTLAESLGGVESLIEVPVAMTHASTADAPFAVPDNLVRLSVGIESADGPGRRPRAGARRVVGPSRPPRRPTPTRGSPGGLSLDRRIDPSRWTGERDRALLVDGDHAPSATSPGTSAGGRVAGEVLRLARPVGLHDEDVKVAPFAVSRRRLEVLRRRPRRLEGDRSPSGDQSGTCHWPGRRSGGAAAPVASIT